MIDLLNLSQAELHAQDDLLAQLADLEKQLFTDGWDSRAILSVLAQFGAGVLVCVKHGKLVGYCIYAVVFEVAEVLRIATHPDYQRQGIGKALLDEFIKLSKSKQAEWVLLEVRVDNLGAIQLYQKQGFYQIDVRQGYYDGVDALILQLDLIA